MIVELFVVQRPVVECRRQPEPEVDQRRLAGEVAVEHAAYLRNRDVRLVDEHQEVVREVVEERPGRAALRAPCQVPAVVLDARAVAGLAHGLKVVVRTLFEPRRFEYLALLAQIDQPLAQLHLDVRHRFVEFAFRRDEVLRRVDVHFLAFGEQLPRQRIDLDDALDLVAEEVDAHRQLLV